MSRLSETTIVTKAHDYTNRKQIREAKRELTKIYNALWSVERRFYDDLFNSDSSFSYNDIYEHYLSQYQNNCQYVESVVKPKYFRVNKHYFSDSFSC